MPILLQINTDANLGSTGRIAENIGILAQENGWETVVAYGRENNNSKLQTFRIGSDLDVKLHGIETRLFDNHGLASRKATTKFIEWTKEHNPDIIHLHNIHGYYLNYQILFKFLKEWGGPVVWTLHDCWPFTGHCTYYSFEKCSKWEKGCYRCPQLSNYPSSFGRDRSALNYMQKKESFSNLPNLQIVTVSNWLQNEVKKSFLGNYDIHTIYNGIDLNVFRPYDNKKKGDKTILLGVANIWDKRKGLYDFIKLRSILPDNYIIKLVGLSNKQIRMLPEGITGIERTANTQQLAEIYSSSDIYINASVEETLGMTSIEAMACGTPSIVYNSTACSEPIEKNICKVVNPNDIYGIVDAIKKIESLDCKSTTETLKKWVTSQFDKNKCFQQYIDLYEKIQKK